MEKDLLDIIVSDESPSDISDKIKEILFSKSAEKIDAYKETVASRIFNSDFDSEGEDI
jgi:hypothetical protein